MAKHMAFVYKPVLETSPAPLPHETESEQSDVQFKLYNTI